MSPGDARKALEGWSKDHSLFTDDEVHALLGVAQGGGDASSSVATGKVTALPEVKIEASPKDHTPFPDDAISTPITRAPPEPDTQSAHTEYMAPDKFALIGSNHDKWANDLFVPKTSPEAKLSASGVKELYRDPEYHAPQPQHDGLVGSLLHPLDSIAAASEKLPHFLGGGTEHMYEPSAEQFLRDEGPYLPPKFHQAHTDTASIEQSPEFRMYADAQWAKAHDQAKAEGRSVARHAYVSDEGWANKVRNMAVGGAGHVAAGVNGAADAMTFGLGPKLADVAFPDEAAGRQSLVESHPEAHTAGAIAGFASPGGFGNELAGGAAGLAKGLAPAAAKAVPRFVQAGAKGALAAGTDVLGRAGVNAASGNPTDWNATGRDAAIAALLGGGMGAGFDALGQAANFHGTNLREKIPALPVAEGFGGKTSVVSGFEPGKRYGELVAEGNAQSPKVHPVSLLAQKLEGPISQAASDVATEGRAATGKVNSAYYAEHGNTRVPVTPLLDAATELHEGLHDPSGNPLPGQHEQASGMLRREIGKMAETKMRPEGPHTLGFDEAEAKGHNIDHLFRGLDQDQIDMIRSGGMGQGVEVRPRAYNPKETDQIVSGLDAALKAAHGPGGGPHPELNKLLEASRAVRDQFPDSANVPGGNWADFKHNASVRQAVEERAADMAGAPGLLRGTGKAGAGREAPPLTAAEAKNLFNTIAGSGGPSGEPTATGRHPEVDTALAQYAQRAGGAAPQNLADIPRVKAVEAVRDRAATKVKIHNGFPMTNLSGEGARMRLDPIMSRLALPSTQLGGLRGGGLGGAGAYPHYRQGQSQNEPPPASLDEINRLLNPNQPY